MVSTRMRVLRELHDGTLSSDSPLAAVHALGPYLVRRLVAALRLTSATVGGFWRGMRARTGPVAQRLLHRALQNKKCNQCVSARAGGSQRAYHTGDINRWGYEACAALLEYAHKTDPRARHGMLTRTLGTRSRASTLCGCRDAAAGCNDRMCTRAADGTCIPRAHNATGFLSPHPRPTQVAAAATGQQLAAIRRAGRVRGGAALRADPDATADVAAGHARTARYSSPRSGRTWRVPGPVARLPILRI